MTRGKKLTEPDQPYNLFFPDTVRDQLARVKKKTRRYANRSGSDLRSAVIIRSAVRS